MNYAYNTNSLSLEPLQRLLFEIQRPDEQTASACPGGFDICADDGSLFVGQAKSENGYSPEAKFLEDDRLSCNHHTKKFEPCQDIFKMLQKDEISNRVTKWLQDRAVSEGWSSAELAREIGISPQHLDMLFRKTRGYGRKTIKRIETRFKTTLKEILGIDREIEEMRDREALISHWRELANHYKRLYDDLREQVKTDPLLRRPPSGTKGNGGR